MSVVNSPVRPEPFTLSVAAKFRSCARGVWPRNSFHRWGFEFLRRNYMRVFVTCLLALGLATSPAWAGDDGKKDTADSTKTTSPDKTAKSDKTADSTKTAASETSPVIETELQQMRDLLKSQADQLEEQRAALSREETKIQDLESRLHVTETNGTAPGGSVPSGTLAAPASGATPAPEGQAAMKSDEPPAI